PHSSRCLLPCFMLTLLLDALLSLYFFSSLAHPAPISTLFPYTTLFRSRFVFVYLIPIAWTTTIPASALTGRLEPGFESPREGGRDRKSTRLNSSHQIISYAVFCLKKKNTKEILHECLIGHGTMYEFLIT